MLARIEADSRNFDWVNLASQAVVYTLKGLLLSLNDY